MNYIYAFEKMFGNKNIRSVVSTNNVVPVTLSKCLLDDI